MIFVWKKTLFLLCSFVLYFVSSLSAFATTPTTTLIVVSGNSKEAVSFISQLNKNLLDTKIVDVLSSPKSDILDQLESATNIVIIGNESLKYYLANQFDKPALVIYVKRSTFHHLTEAYKHLNLIEGKRSYFNKISVIYSDPSLSSQFSLISKHYPTKDVTVIISPLNEFLKSALNSAAKAEKISLNILAVNSKVDINRALNSIPKNHALLAIPDPTIYNRHSLKNIIISTYRSNRPVFGYSENMVKAGSVASYYTDMTDLAREVADILNILNSKDTPYREHSKYNKLTINVAVARSLNLNSLKSSL